MKKVFGLIIVLFSVIALVSCKKEKVIKFAVQADSTPALEAIVAEFNKGDHGYKVEIVKMPNDSNQMRDNIITSLSSGSDDYDLVSMDVVWAGQFAAAGYLEPLDELIDDADWKISDFNNGSMASGKYSGKHFSLPYFPDLGFLYYRKDLVDATDSAKLASGNYTWNDLLTMAEKYATSSINGIVFQAIQNEGLICNFNEFSDNFADIENGLKLMKAFTDATFTPNDILTYDEAATHTAFLQGKAVFARNWPYMNGMVSSDESEITPEQVGYAPLPLGGTVGGWLVGINKNTDVMEGAKEFIQFFTGPKGQKINALKGSYIPGYNELLEDEEVLEANAILNSDAFQKALQTTIARPVSPNYAELSYDLQLAIHKYLAGDATLQATLTAIEEALDE
jgi:multiple sugar transport system substrate-binding protein